VSLTESGELGSNQYRLRVEEILPETERVVSVILADPMGGALPSWDPGSHIDILLPSGRIRQYSLCGDLHDDRSYRLGVLLETYEHGASKELHSKDLVGQLLTIREPRNLFPLEYATRYLFLAGGIGITPILSMLQWAEEHDRPWKLLYGARSQASMAFSDEVLARQGGSVDLVVEDECGLPEFREAVEAAPLGTHVYACGSDAMLETVLDCEGCGIPAGAVHVERFSPLGGASAAMLRTGIPFQVELRRSGTVLDVPQNRSLLSVLRDVVAVPYSCELGNCGGCEVDVLDGIPDHRDVVLTASVRAANRKIIACVSRAYSQKLILDL
jgi:ferredoxin-NADP reductase